MGDSLNMRAPVENRRENGSGKRVSLNACIFQAAAVMCAPKTRAFRLFECISASEEGFSCRQNSRDRRWGAGLDRPKKGPMQTLPFAQVYD